MYAILNAIKENYQTFIVIGVLIVLLNMSGNITTTLKGAKKGLSQSVTPLGFVIFLTLAYLAYKAYLEIAATL